MGWNAGAQCWIPHRHRFAAVAKGVEELAGKGSYDGYLGQGGLGCPTCKRMMEVATAQSCTAGIKWSGQEVQQYAREAVWSFIFDASDAWAYWSARKFLELCAELGLAIYFY